MGSVLLVSTQMAVLGCGHSTSLEINEGNFKLPKKSLYSHVKSTSFLDGGLCGDKPLVPLGFWEARCLRSFHFWLLTHGSCGENKTQSQALPRALVAFLLLKDPVSVFRDPPSPAPILWPKFSQKLDAALAMA